MTPTTNNVGPTTSATERLRALLDERGVEWRRTPHYSSESIDNETVFRGEGIEWYANDHLNGRLGLRALRYEVTPEQAVAATLGETPTPHVEDLGRLHDELRDAIVEILGNRCDWDQAGVRHAHEVLERAATLGRGTCREVKIDRYWRGCGECGYVWEFMYGIGKCERPRYCPNCGRNCGRKVEE